MTANDRESRLARLAREALPGVLDAAMARAREDAVARLAALLSDAIVAEALAEERHPGSPVREAHSDAPSTPEERPAPDGRTTLYAYAITRADLRLPHDVPALTEGEHVSRVTDADLALLVSPLAPDELRVDEDDLSETGRLATLARGHDAVLRAAAAAGPVLPLRFGTAVADEDAACRLLRDHAAAARQQLERIGDTREWGVRLVRSLPEAEPSVAARPHVSEHRADLSGTEYLSRRRQALAEHDRSEQDAARAAARVEETLAPHVAESLRRGGSPGSSLLLDIACLVAPAREAGFAAAVADLVEELRPEGLDVELTGPWPPYSFASLDGSGAEGVRDGA